MVTVSRRAAGRPERAIARVLRNGRAVGLAFPVDAYHLVTCAHVVNAALGRPARETSTPPACEQVAVVFAFGAEDGTADRVATVTGWLPEQGEFDRYDVAVLRLEQELPEGAGPLALAGGDPTGEVQMWGPSTRRSTPGHVQGLLVGEVEDGRWQIDQQLRGVFRVQPGFSGGPVWRPRTGEVVGVLQAVGTGEAATDAYVIGVDVITRAWPAGIPAAAGIPGAASIPAAAGTPAWDGAGVTVLHLGDMQFGAHHRFGAEGLTEADRRHDSLAARLLDDLTQLRDSHALAPDLVVVAGDLAETAKPAEYEAVQAFLEDLRTGLDIPTERIVVVPGNHDVNRKRCQAYFLECADDEQPPVPPYWRKWEPFAAMYARFYGVSFAKDQPWSYLELPELRVAVAGLNSTMADSHRDTDHYGWLGDDQLHYFARRLAGARAKGWLCLGVLHHNPVRGTGLDDAHLRDADRFTELLAPHLDVVLHGHTHQARVEHLGPTALPVLGTGSAGVGAGARPDEVPNQYQLLRLRPNQVQVWARRYDPGRRRWLGDTAISADGNDWRRTIPIRPAPATRAGREAGRAGREPGAPRLHRDYPPDDEDPRACRFDRPEDLLARVRVVCELRQPGARIEEVVRADLPVRYLHVSDRRDVGIDQYPIGVYEGTPTQRDIEQFWSTVDAQYRTGGGPGSRVVYGGAPAPPELWHFANRKGIELVSFAEYQLGYDLRPYAARQAESLAYDPNYPPELYLPGEGGVD